MPMLSQTCKNACKERHIVFGVCLCAGGGGWVGGCGLGVGGYGSNNSGEFQRVVDYFLCVHFTLYLLSRLIFGTVYGI